MGNYVDRDGNSIWLADSDGGGWFALAIIVALPVFIFGIIVSSIVVWITEHFLAASGIFLLVNIGVSFILSMKRKKAKELIIDFAANIMLFQTLFFTAALYGIPYVIDNDSWWDVFELAITVAINLGIIILMKAIGKLHNNPLINLITSFLFGIVYVFLMNRLLKNIMNAEKLMEMYHINKGWVFNLFFGLFFI